MFSWKFYKYALAVSIIAIILIALFSPQYFWPWSIAIFVFQLLAVLIANWLIKVVRYDRPERRYLEPGFLLYRRYFSAALSIYLLMGVFGIVENTYAVVYFSLFVIGFIGISISMLFRIMVEGDLLDEYNEREDKE